MTTLPKLPAPEIIGVAGFCDDGIGYTEAQVLKLRADTVEACADLCDTFYATDPQYLAKSMRDMLTQGETECSD